MKNIHIKTPKGGKGLYLLHITHKDDILGVLKFDNMTALEEFENNYAQLCPKAWGRILMIFDHIYEEKNI